MKLKIKQILESKEKSVYWLRNATGISHKAIYDMVNGKTKSISFDNIEKICTALDCTPSDLFEIEPK